MNWAEIIKAVAWPVTVLCLAFGFRASIKEVLVKITPKLKSLTLGNAKLDFDAAGQQATPAPPDVISPDKIELQEFPGLTRTKAMGMIERHLLASLAANPMPSDKAIPLLVRNLAQTRLEARFGLIYSQIFGTQIRWLEALGACRTVTNAEALAFYEEAIAAEREFYESYGFTGWLSFLKNHSLIEQDNARVVITDLGDDFLLWLQVTPVPKTKPH
jgi:hypothetical protein